MKNVTSSLCTSVSAAEGLLLQSICIIGSVVSRHRGLPSLSLCLAVSGCRKFVVKQLAQQLRPQLEAIVQKSDAPADEVYSPDAKSAARRAIKNKALAYLAALGEDSVTQQVLDRFRNATNMTDKISALSALIDSEGRLLALTWQQNIVRQFLVKAGCNLHLAL